MKCDNIRLLYYYFVVNLIIHIIVVQVCTRFNHARPIWNCWVVDGYKQFEPKEIDSCIDALFQWAPYKVSIGYCLLIVLVFCVYCVISDFWTCGLSEPLFLSLFLQTHVVLLWFVWKLDLCICSADRYHEDCSSQEIDN